MKKTGSYVFGTFLVCMLKMSSYVKGQPDFYNVIIAGFYRIQGLDHSAYAYAYFIHGGYPKVHLRIYGSIRCPCIQLSL